MPRKKSSRSTTKRTKRVEKSKLPEINFAKSYTSLLYGVLTVLVLFLLLYAGVKIFSHTSPSIGNSGVSTEKITQTQTQKQNKQNIYVVKTGDNLWAISQKEYGTGYSWTLIAKANNLDNPGAIDKGQKLTIPQAPSVTPTSGVNQKANATITPVQGNVSITPSLAQKTAVVNGQEKNAITTGTYTVEKGDYLWEIAIRAYGNGYRWVDIAKANNLTNPDLIFSGNVLTLPRP